MKFVSARVIEIKRELSDLDKFTLEFVRVLRKYTKYAIVSGYVSILFGRARASEDVDIIIPRMPFQEFKSFLDELAQKKFYCLNAEDNKEIYEYLKDNLAIRFAKENTVIPNMELKFARKEIDDITLNNTITVKLNEEELIISHLEMQIAFKEKVLKSDKDMEDARHLRNVAKNHIDGNLIKKYEGMLNEFY